MTPGSAWPLSGQPPAPVSPPLAGQTSPTGPAEPAEVDAALDRAVVREISDSLVEVLSDGLDRARAQQLIATQVRQWAHERVGAGLPLLSAGTQRRLGQAVYDHRYGLGGLQPFLARPDVENIVVNGCEQTWITYTDGRKQPGPPVADSDEELVDWIQQLARRGNSNREFSHAHPLLDIALPGGVRLAVAAYVSRRPHLAFRLHRLVDITLDRLTHKHGTLTEPLAQFLAAAVRARKNIIVDGEVNTGKTTLIRALANEIDPDERIITLESDFELFLDDTQLRHRHHDVVALEARHANSEGAGEVTLQDLVPASLRLNPDRIIVGEARHGELAPMLEVMYSGARGSMCTLHVHRPGHIFARVVQLGRRAGLGLTPADLHQMFGLAEPLVVHLARDPHTNHRYVTDVLEVGPPADGTEPTRQHIFTPGPDGRAVPDAGHASTDLLRDLADHGLDLQLLSYPTGRWPT